MATDIDDINETIENLKNTVKKSFARIYSSLKARELKTIRQLDAILKQCQDNKDLQRKCVQNISISFDNESELIENISIYGAIDFEKLSFDNSTFLLEDYVSPNDDHMYSYKTIEELTIDKDENLEAIEEAALKQITDTDDCVCIVNINSMEVAKKFRDTSPNISSDVESPDSSQDTSTENKEEKSSETVVDDECSECSDAEVKKIDPTDDWLNSIKSQTETEPSQVTDVMEHSTITCS